MATIQRQRALAEQSQPRAPAPPSRNPGIPLELDWVRDVRVNRSAVERRAATIGTRRTVKQAWQAGWLLRAVTLLDLTTLSGDDTPGRVQRLCAKARQPLRADLRAALGLEPFTVGAVCVYHAMLPTAVASLAGSVISIQLCKLAKSNKSKSVSPSASPGTAKCSVWYVA